MVVGGDGGDDGGGDGGDVGGGDAQSAALLHLSRNLSSSTICAMSKVLRLPRNLHFEVKPLRSLLPVTKSRLGTTKTRGFPCACHHHDRKCARHHNESAAPTQILRACAVEMHFEDFERHECAVNSNELAGHARALQRSKHQLLNTYRKNS